jgi:hypothetical protein
MNNPDSMTDMFVVHKRIPYDQIFKQGESAKEQLAEWFENNPDKIDCQTEVWYNRRILIQKDTIDDQIDDAVKEACNKA